MARIFMLSPFGEPFDSFFFKLLKPSLSDQGHIISRSDESYAPGAVVQSIFQAILDADIVVADVTRSNANVFYEIGIAHSYGKHVILVAQSTDDLPYDIRHMRCIRYQPGTANWDEKYVSELAQAVEDAKSSEDGVAALCQRVFAGKCLRRFKEVLEMVERMLADSESYFFVSRTSPNEAALLPHEGKYYQTTDSRIKGTDTHAPIPNYRRLISLASADSLNMGLALLEKYWQSPNFQLAVCSNRRLHVNFEVFVSDDRAVLLAFGTEQSGGPLDSGLFIRNEAVAVKWKSFFLNLWDHPETCVVKGHGSLNQQEHEAAIERMKNLFRNGEQNRHL